MGFRRDKQGPEVSEPKMVDESIQPQAGDPDLDWKPNTQQKLVMLILSIISFMVSLDATIIVTSLNVRQLPASDLKSGNVLTL